MGDEGGPLRWQAFDAPVGEVRLRVRRLVGVAGAPVLLLHGLGVSGAVWQAFGRRLAPRFAAVAPDLRGHGESDAPPSGYEPADYAGDLAGLVGEVSAGGVPVVGHSLGALVALALAELWPERVSALVLLDPPVDPEGGTRDVPHVYRLRSAPEGELEAFLLRGNPGGGKLLAEALAGMFRRAADQAFETMLAAPTGHPEAWERAARVRQPTLLVQADPAAGGSLGDAAAEAFAARLANGQRLKIAGAPHAVHASHPAELARAIQEFLGN